MIIGSGLEYQRVAEELGISKYVLSHWLSDDLSEGKAHMIIEAIKSIKGES